MPFKSKTMLITGGASGIGLALAERFLEAGNEVIACGRREAKLLEAKKANPALHTFCCDVSQASERLRLYEWAVKNFPNLDVLVNNAGVQRRLDLQDQEDWDLTREELATNIEAPIHLARLFIPHFLTKSEAAILNVTSGLAFAPLANVPVYSASKAALRSFTLSLRHQLKDTSIRVFEIIPPAVDTDLGGPGLHTFGVPLNLFADSIVKDLQRGDLEVAFGRAEDARKAAPDELVDIFKQLNSSNDR